MSKVFLDTNILIYAASKADDNDYKQAIAAKIVDDANFVVSTIVLGEFFNVATKKAKLKISPQQAITWVELFNLQYCALIDLTTMRSAMLLSQQTQLTYYDATHICVARKLGLSTIYSEDYSDTQDYGDVRVINPFKMN